MVGVRVAPDGYDVVVWKLDDSGAPFVNSSTSINILPSSNLTTLSGSVLLQQPSLFAATGINSCVQFTGNQSGSPRNFISGANTVQPQAPVSFSCWLFLRNYNNTASTQHLWVKQTTTGVWSGSTFASVEIQTRGFAGQPMQFDAFVLPTSGSTPLIPVENTIPLNTWTHTAVTWDGTTQLVYVNGNNVASASSTGPIVYGGGGPWFFGAIPSGSGAPEESSISICDFRIANIVRPQSYFQNIYQSGILNAGAISLITQYYKMRAYDLSCRRPFPVYWVDTAVNYNNAPAPPCGGPLGPIEIVEVFPILNG